MKKVILLIIIMSININAMPKEFLGKWSVDIGRVMTQKNPYVTELPFEISINAGSLELHYKGVELGGFQKKPNKASVNFKIEKVSPKKVVVMTAKDQKITITRIDKSNLLLNLMGKQLIALTRDKKTNTIVVDTTQYSLINGKIYDRWYGHRQIKKLKKAELYADHKMLFADAFEFTGDLEKCTIIFSAGVKAVCNKKTIVVVEEAEPGADPAPKKIKQEIDQQDIVLIILSGSYRLDGKGYQLEQVIEKLKEFKKVKTLTLRVERKVRVKQVYEFVKALNRAY